MLRKLIRFAITSGLAKKAWDSYWRKQNPFPTAAASPQAAARPEAAVPRARANANELASQALWPLLRRTFAVVPLDASILVAPLRRAERAAR